MRYAAFLPPPALARIHAALGDHGTVDALADVRQLLAELTLPHDECLVLDPALITPAIAENIAMSLAKFPRALVAYSSVTTAALESGVVLAQRTTARFIFRGTPNERSALERALLLTPDSELGLKLLYLLEPNMSRLPAGLQDRLTAMFRNGDGPYSPEALASSAALARRSLDRYLAEAGLVSARRIIEAARIVSSYRAITSTQIPLRHIAGMLGYKAQRTLDAQLMIALNTTASRLRLHPPSCTAAAASLGVRLTTNGAFDPNVLPPSRQAADGAERSLRRVGGSHARRQVRITFDNTAPNQ